MPTTLPSYTFDETARLMAEGAQLAAGRRQQRLPARARRRSSSTAARARCCSTSTATG